MNPWDRQDYDTDKSFAAFSIYRDLGSNRSLSQVAEQHPSDLRQIKKWSSDHNWVERVAAFDRHLDRLAQQENEQVWLERIKKQKEDEWTARNQLLELTTKQLQYPLAEQTLDDDGHTIIFKPARWGFRDISRNYLAMSTLGRRATGLDQGEDLIELEEGIGLLVSFFQIIKEEIKDEHLLERLEQRFRQLLGEHGSGTTIPPETQRET